MGNIYCEQKKYPQAVKQYRMALDQVPNTHKDMRYLGDRGSEIVLLTKREVNMAGYWPSSPRFAFLRTETKLRSMKMPRSTRPMSSHLDRTSLVNKGFIIWPKGYTKYFFQCVGECFRS